MKDNEYKAWEKDVEAAEKHNNILIKEFKKYLEDKSLRPKTIKSHIDNINFYANNFLLYYDVTLVEEGFLRIGSFLGDYFIRKTTWSSKASIKENIASFKKFYSFLNEKGLISSSDLAQMKDLIKFEKDDWLDAVENYWDY